MEIMATNTIRVPCVVFFVTRGWPIWLEKCSHYVSVLFSVDSKHGLIHYIIQHGETSQHSTIVGEMQDWK